MSFDDKQEQRLRDRFLLPPNPTDSATQLALGLARPITGTQSQTPFQRDQECRANPSPLTGRAPDARAGCGWLFSEDGPSTGAYGSRRGPMNPDDREWIWDQQEAYKRESMKRAARLDSCKDLALVTDPRIGWCVGTGRGVVTSGGAPAFPRMAGGDCAGPIIMNAAQCPVGSTNGITDVCTPVEGRLTAGCLERIVPEAGCAADGALAQALRSGYAGTSDAFRNADRYLQQRGFSLHAGIVNDGRVSMEEAMNNVRALRALTDPNDGGRAAQAARNLCFGTPFDPCAIQAAEMGPFDPVCLRGEALRIGFRPEGHVFRTLQTWSATRTWSDVQAELRRLKSVADRGEGKAQAAAIGDVYGLSVKFPPQGCNIQGITMYRYFFPSHIQALFPIEGPQTHFLGRYILKNGFPNTGSTFQDQTPAGGILTEGQRMVTNFVPTMGGTYIFTIACDDYVRLQINGQVLAEVGCCNVPTPSRPITLIAGQSYRLVVDLWNGGGPWSFVMTMTVNGTPQPLPISQMYMPEDRRMPLFDLEFGVSRQSGDRIWDRNELHQNLATTWNRTAEIAGRRCWPVAPGRVISNNMKYSQGFRARAFKTITLMVYVIALDPAGPAVSKIFSFFNTSQSATLTNPRGRPTEYTGNDGRTQDLSLWLMWGRIQLQYRVQARPVIQTQYYYNDQTIKFNKWTHIAIVWDDDWEGYAMYLDGKLAGQLRAPGPAPNQIFEQFRLSDEPGWEGGIAWFRGFDYRLGPELIERDMANDWASL